MLSGMLFGCGSRTDVFSEDGYGVDVGDGDDGLAGKATVRSGVGGFRGGGTIATVVSGGAGSMTATIPSLGSVPYSWGGRSTPTTLRGGAMAMGGRIGTGGRTAYGGSTWINSRGGATAAGGRASEGGRPARGGSAAMGGSIRAWGGSPPEGGYYGFGGYAAAGFPAKGGTYSYGGYAEVGGASFGGRYPLGGMGGRAFGGASPAGGTGDTLMSVCNGLATNECQQCQCATCVSSMADCAYDSGCRSLVVCALRETCLAPQCFVSGPCADVVADLGGILGPSVMKALSVVLCTSTAQSTCPCYTPPA